MLFFILLVLLCLPFTHSLAWTAVPVASDPLVRMPGTQPAQAVTIEAPRRCMNCHAGYDAAVEPGTIWHGGMMAQAARDPVFWACFTVAAQDSIWALGTPNAGDLCERCHFPEGWLAGRSDPPNASLMTGSDFDGIHCDFCHSLWNPFFETTHTGVREGSDWIGYWDEHGNSGPGSGTLSQTSADTTLSQDRSLSGAIPLFAGGTFFQNYLPHYYTYAENGSGQYYASGGGQKRAGFADANGRHTMLYSRYHKSKYACQTCHDVSNPALANLGLSGLPDQSGGQHLISEQYSAAQYFHVERTFSEFMLSAYGQGSGAATNPEYQNQGGGTVTWAAKCQDCHMRDVTGKAANKPDSILRPTGSSEHPNSGLPLHDMTGGNAWISYILASLDSTGPVYDAVNLQILNQGPSILTLDLSLGETPTGLGQAMKNGADRAKTQLRSAATLKNLQYNPQTGALTFRILNNTPHKLISGFPEGRRVFANIKIYNDTTLLHEINPYDYTVATLRGLPSDYSPNSPPLSAGETHLDELVYEIHPKSSLTGENQTFHFVLATGREKDNRIPPKGFLWQQASERLCEPVWHGVSQPEYFTSAEYQGGYDDVALITVAGGDRVEVKLYYQGTSREYIEFLRDEINGVGGTLSSPAPSGEPQAYIIQTDPFFTRLKAWGNAIWQLWYHNHGLDGGGRMVDCIVPYLMNSLSIDLILTPTPVVSITPTPTLTATYTHSPTETPTQTPTWRPSETPTLAPTPDVTMTPICHHDGDVNLDSDISAEDSQLAFVITIGLYYPSYIEACAADCNGNGDISAEDAQIIFSAVLGLGSCTDIP